MRLVPLLLSALICAATSVRAQTATPWESGTYVYDGAGNIKAIGASDAFRYDALGRLVSGTAGAGAPAQSVTYDAFGNIRTMTTGNVQTTFGVDPATNRMSRSSDPATGATFSAYGSYDAAGRLVDTFNGGGDTFSYDAVDMVTRTTVDGVTKIHLYTANDERISSVTVAGGAVGRSEWTLRDASGKVLRRLDKNGQDWTWKEDYIYRGTQLLAAEVAGPEQTLHFHPDHLGTPRLITGNGGMKVSFHTYYPFGQEATNPSQDAEKLKFTGHERDSEKLDYMHARYYFPKWGRFLSVDPSRDSIDPRRPQTWNRYAYALNNPMTLIDPTGLNAEVFCDQHGDCTAAAVAQVVADPADPVATQTANDFKQAAESYWNGRTTTGPNGENVTFSLTLNIVAPGQQAAGVDTVTVVNGAGVSNIDMTLGPQPIPDTGEIFTNDTTGNVSGMAGIGPHEAGHLYGLRDMYWVNRAAGTREQVPYNPSPNADIMRHAQPTNGAHTAFMVMSPVNRNVVIYRQSGPRTGCRC